MRSGIVLLIVAGFGIYNILNMMIYEKLDAIAILKATGFNGSDVQRIFLLLSIIIGVVGGLGGLVGGFALQKMIDNIPFVTEALPTITTFPIDYSLRVLHHRRHLRAAHHLGSGLVPGAQGQPSGSGGDHPREMSDSAQSARSGEGEQVLPRPRHREGAEGGVAWRWRGVSS